MTEIEYEGKKYNFSWYSIILFWVFTPIVAIIVYKTTDYFWLYTHKPVVEQTVWLINLVTHMNISWNLVYGIGGEPLSYQFFVPGRGPIYFTTMCTGVQAIAVFAGIILMIPHSKDKTTNKHIWLRKLLSFVVSSAIFYIVNILRMLLQLYLYYIGYNWDDIHVSISAASSFIAAIIIILLHKWIPEFIISIVWTMVEIKAYIQRKKGITPPTSKLSENDKAETDEKSDKSEKLEENNTTRDNNKDLTSNAENKPE
ncbi:MAG: archaeosortase H [Promethearchaeota archaeon]